MMDSPIMYKRLEEESESAVSAIIPIPKNMNTIKNKCAIEKKASCFTRRSIKRIVGFQKMWLRYTLLQIDKYHAIARIFNLLQ
jgi:hypothetical protein